MWISLALLSFTFLRIVHQQLIENDGTCFPEYDKIYRIKHVQSGKYLTSVENKRGNAQLSDYNWGQAQKWLMRSLVIGSLPPTTNQYTIHPHVKLDKNERCIDGSNQQNYRQGKITYMFGPCNSTTKKNRHIELEENAAGGCHLNYANLLSSRIVVDPDQIRVMFGDKNDSDVLQRFMLYKDANACEEIVHPRLDLPESCIVLTPLQSDVATAQSWCTNGFAGLVADDLRLASLPDLKTSYIAWMMKDAYSGGVNARIGLSKVSSVWTWSNGEAAGEVDWAPGHPLTTASFAYQQADDGKIVSDNGETIGYSYCEKPHHATTTSFEKTYLMKKLGEECGLLGGRTFGSRCYFYVNSEQTMSWDECWAAIAAIPRAKLATLKSRELLMLATINPKDAWIALKNIGGIANWMVGESTVDPLSLFRKRPVPDSQPLSFHDGQTDLCAVLRYDLTERYFIVYKPCQDLKRCLAVLPINYEGFRKVYGNKKLIPKLGHEGVLLGSKNMTDSGSDGLRECAFECMLPMRWSCASFNYNRDTAQCEMLALNEQSASLNIVSVEPFNGWNHYEFVYDYE